MVLSVEKDRENVMSEKTESIVPSDYLHDDVQAVAEYRSVSRLAVLAAVLGVCSAVALASSQLLVIPLLGIICTCWPCGGSRPATANWLAEPPPWWG